MVELSHAFLFSCFLLATHSSFFLFRFILVFLLRSAFQLRSHCKLLKDQETFFPFLPFKKNLTLLVSVFCLQVYMCTMHCLVPMEVYKGTWSCKSWKASIWGWELKPGLPLEQPLCLTAESIVAAPFCPLVFIFFHLLGGRGLTLFAKLALKSQLSSCFSLQSAEITDRCYSTRLESILKSSVTTSDRLLIIIIQ